jgi:hypothetical protein
MRPGRGAAGAGSDCSRGQPSAAPIRRQAPRVAPLDPGPRYTSRASETSQDRGWVAQAKWLSRRTFAVTPRPDYRTPKLGEASMMTHARERGGEVPYKVLPTPGFRMARRHAPPTTVVPRGSLTAPAIGEGSAGSIDAECTRICILRVWIEQQCGASRPRNEQESRNGAWMEPPPSRTVVHARHNRSPAPVLARRIPRPRGARGRARHPQWIPCGLRRNSVELRRGRPWARRQTTSESRPLTVADFREGAAG